ncbi:uncharacterized protein LOC130449894 [Diorhabda sublineata]|uniref:uncharacterized protein LOC130449894 n=1 Tax=Diorhabda sublineata TaxID=1163346 RepID=UPI0024E177E4|nr:uncharacterized protein LOC130449894 [Diorhabda sublineata]
MMGHISGVKARLKAVIPDLYVLGCTCHSFHLCASAACLKLPRTIEQFARDIYNYFSNSCKRYVELRVCQVFLDMKPNKLLRPSQTRWLSLQMVVKKILHNWQPLTLFFQGALLEDRLQSSQNILNALSNPVYKLYFLFLNFILEAVNKLNLEFQSEKPKITSLYDNVTNLNKLVLKSFIKKEILDFFSLSDLDPSNQKYFVDLSQLYLGAKVEQFLKENCENLNENDIKSFQYKCREFYVELCVQIKKRFPFEDKFLKSITVLNPDKVMSGNIPTITNILNFFPQLKDLCNLEDINLECPNLKKFVTHILSLPHFSAAAERVFSQLFLIKTKPRNRLDVKTCQSLLYIKYYVKDKAESIARTSSSISTFTGNSPIEGTKKPVMVYSRKRLFQALVEKPCSSSSILYEPSISNNMETDKLEGHSTVTVE